MQRVLHKQVRLISKLPIELEPGVVLPPGRYWATKTRTAVEESGGWSAPQFSIEFIPDQLAQMGAAKTKTSKTIDVTEWVRVGKLEQRH